MNNWDQYQSTPKLLPPTVFEKISNNMNNSSSNNEIGSSSNNTNNSSNQDSTINESSYFSGESQFAQFTNELEKLKNEIKKLHNENETLRHKNKDFVDQAQLYTEVSEHRKISISALEEIIHKQTREIQTLKFDLVNEKDSNQIKLKDFESKYTQKVNDLVSKINDAEKELKDYVKESEKKVENLKAEHEKSTNEQNLRIKSLQNEKLNLIDSYNNDIDGLKENIEKLKSEKKVQAEENESRIKSLCEENKKYLSELQNLRNYVNDSMPTIQTIKEMTVERQTYEEQILKIKSKNDLLQKENNALQIRLKSINEILTIQEAQLDQSPKSISSTSSLLNDKKRAGLLNKWRAKVYELLVQLKSQEISFKQEKSMSEKCAQEFSERLEHESAKNRILENTIEDKKAEISVLSNDLTDLNEQLSVLKETNENLEKKSQQDLQSSIELKNFVNSLITNYQKIEESFRTANKKLNHLDQRVEFAKNRLGVIKALYQSQRQEIKRGNILDMTTNLSSIHASIGHNEQTSNLNNNPPLSLELHNDMESVNFIKNELNKVVSERDLLAHKLQTDMETMNDKIRKMKDDYEIVILTLNNELRELREMNELKQQQIDQASQQLQEKGGMCEDLHRKYEDLSNKFNELKSELNLDHESNIRERESQYMDKMASINEKLNEARREQAKAVVLMRQMERSTNREKERMENLLKSCDNYYKEHVKKLETKVVSLEKEKNIIMNSLKQQGNLFNNSAVNTEVHQTAHKSPVNFLNPNIDNWLDKNIALNKNNSENRQMPAEITSFWLDSKQNIDDDVEEENLSKANSLRANKIYADESEYQNIQENEEENESEQDEELDSSDLNKNSEILLQIRKIMGNLELSDVDDENETGNENELSYDNRQKYLENTKEEDYENEESRGNKPYNDDYEDKEYQYEIEHAIDDIFSRKNDSFSN